MILLPSNLSVLLYFRNSFDWLGDHPYTNYRCVLTDSSRGLGIFHINETHLMLNMRFFINSSRMKYMIIQFQVFLSGTFIQLYKLILITFIGFSIGIYIRGCWTRDITWRSYADPGPASIPDYTECCWWWTLRRR